MALTTARVWTSDFVVAGNTARQLLVPNGSLDVLGEGERLTVSNRFGRWRATHDTTEVAGDLAAVLPRLSSSGRVSWVGNRLPFTPAQVAESHRGAFEFRNFEEPNSLRRPQIGALHSIMGYWSSGLNTPGIVVMPTGTGKTETMLALLVAARPGLLLVIVPTVALRDQIAGKFESLGVLQELQIVSAQAQRPVVGRLAHGLPTAEEADQFASACNVIVATPPALAACSDEARSLLYAACTHLVVDEAHHSAAPTWANIISTFANRPTLLFTATPFREDGHALPGRIIYRFPLREAQADGYFTHIDYRAVLSLQGIDEEVARLAIMRLREDLAAGFDHILMARASSIAGSERLLKIYSAQAAVLGPMVIHERLTAKKRRKTFAALESRECRVIICVDMLGEGFDLPSLKVAALHDVRKSLSPMIQLIGRFTRTSADASIGTASVFVARDPSVALSPLRELLHEDADWNLILRDITERATVAAEEANDFELSFSNTPDDVPLSLLEPKVSAIVHRASTSVWNPEGVLELYEEGEVLGGRIAVGADGSVAWFVIDSRSDVRWGRVPGLEQRTYELIIMYFDQCRRLLYIHGSSNADNYAELAKAVLGEGTSPINGPLTFRVLARLDRLVPTNVGLLDARDHFKRFSMHVGSDVNEALEGVDSFSKTQTHIATTGFDNGERITISAAVSGRIWSMRTATNLKEWVDWCNEQGAKLIDQSIEVTELFSNLMIPIDLEQRPPYVLLGVEWPWTVYLGSSDGLAVTYSDTTYSMTDIDFEVEDFGTAGPFRFSLVTPGWRLPYEASFGPQGLTYTALYTDAQVASRPQSVPLAFWLNRNKPTLFLSGDRMITDQDRLLEPRQDLPPYDPERFALLDWEGVNLHVESQRAERRPESIQAYMSAHLRETDAFDVLLDDDRAGEAADLVGLRVEGPELIVTLVHCKYSSSDVPGARLSDLYEVCGQVVRSAKWRQHATEPLLRHLDRRAKKYMQRTGVTPFEVGDIQDLYRIRETAPQLRPVFRIIIAQPGLSAAACTNEHLSLFAGAESYVRAVTKGHLQIFCSA